MNDQPAIDWFELKDRRWIGIGSKNIFLSKRNLTSDQLIEGADIIDTNIVFVTNRNRSELNITLHEREGWVELLKKQHTFKRVVDATSFRKELLQRFPQTISLRRTATRYTVSGGTVSGLIGLTILLLFIAYAGPKDIGRSTGSSRSQIVEAIFLLLITYKHIVIPLSVFIYIAAFRRIKSNWKRYNETIFYRCVLPGPTSSDHTVLNDNQLLDS